MSLRQAVVDILFVSHRKTSDSPEDTLARVFRKGFLMSGFTDPPPIFPDRLRVSRETRPAASLLPITTRGQKSRVGKKTRHFWDVPIIVAVLDGQEYLIDGNRRVHYLAEQGRDIEVYVCRVN